jgi:ADP-heptose:LPS heptosyltransferase/SAM-dependent methyltransferase
MEHNLFRPRSFDEGKHAVVGDCNGFTMQQRWDAETPAFARAIIRNVNFMQGPTSHINILDYGCGVGRLAKEVLSQSDKVLVVGVDASDDMIKQSNLYVDSKLYSAKRAEDLGGHKFHLVYCVYVLQHCPSIEIREVLSRIHHHLEDDGIFIYCSSDYRMSIRFDGQGFFDDRFLGVNLREEIGRLFDEVKPLFTEDDYSDNPILRKMITGANGGLAHPAFVYKKKVINDYLHIGHEVTNKEEDVNPVKSVVSQIAEPFKDNNRFTKLVLINRLAPGDILVMTNAIRDLHKAYPGKYQTEVRSPCNEIFENSPYFTKLSYDENLYQRGQSELHKGGKDGTTFTIGDILCIDMQYPMIHTSGEAGWHFGYGHRDFLAKTLGVDIPQTSICPEIYLSQSERDWISPVLTVTGEDIKYWVINAGSKGDYTLKQYPFYQEVVDILKDKVKFVQIGLPGHNHKPLNGVIDMVGKTNDNRKLFRVINMSEGVLTCVSFPMHIAAAFRKPCVVVAGAREGTRWELYPNQQFLYVNGCLPCATYDGCWKSKYDDCTNKVDGVARCMTLITPNDVARSIERYYQGGMLQY